jgi:hypothetical protein
VIAGPRLRDSPPELSVSPAGIVPHSDNGKPMNFDEGLVMRSTVLGMFSVLGEAEATVSPRWTSRAPTPRRPTSRLAAM